MKSDVKAGAGPTARDRRRGRPLPWSGIALGMLALALLALVLLRPLEMGGTQTVGIILAIGLPFVVSLALLPGRSFLTRLERRRTKAELARKNKVLMALSELQNHFIGDPDGRAMFEHWIATAVELTASSTGSIVERAQAPSLKTPHLVEVLGDGKTLQDAESITLPLFAGSEIVGAIELKGRRGGYGPMLIEELEPFFTSLGTLIAAHRSARRREEAEARLTKLSMAVEQSPTAVIITDCDGIIEYVNPRFTQMTGYETAEIVGRSPNVLKSGYMPATIYRELWRTVLAGEDWRGEFYNKRKDGGYFWCRTHISPIKGKDGTVTHLVSVAEDISLRKRYEERLLHQANFDQLTNLPNRVLAFDRLCQVLNQAQRRHRPLTVMQVDIDHFKVVNDTLGHTVGDAVLVEAANRLQSCVRKTDTVARLGSDEFLVILADRTDEDPPDLVARRILDTFNRPFAINGSELFLSVCIGLTMAPEDGSLPQALLQNCGVAMSRAKETGRNTYHFFTPGMNQQAAERLEIDAHLRHALPRRELFLCYQPLMDVASGRMVGAEALLRWQSPTLGLVMPDRFIPLAEDSGMIVPIGDWVLTEACRQAKTWIDQGSDMILAVNTSSRQLRHPQLVEDVARALKDSGLAPSRLELEITESILIEDAEYTSHVLNQLIDLGVRLSLDDFGTGYSSLSYLKRYSFRTLKIDRSFIRDVLNNTADRALVKAIIAMARSLNLRLVAEGVETGAQLDFLRDQGCDVIQGYHYSRPLTAAAFDAFQRKQRTLAPPAPRLVALSAG